MEKQALPTILLALIFGLSLGARAQIAPDRISKEEAQIQAKNLIASATSTLDIMWDNSLADDLAAKARSNPSVRIRVHSGRRDPAISFVVKDQEECVFSNSSRFWISHDTSFSHNLSAYLSQKIAYEEQRPLVPSRRFWIGFKREDLSGQEFVNNLNQHLIPDTVKVGTQRGLLAYSPVVLEGLNGVAQLPSEFAIVTYEGDAEYRAIADTPAGTKYQASHWNVFARETSTGLKSGSSVAAPYDGRSLDFGKAYSLPPLQSPYQFQNGTQTYSVLLRKSGQSDETFLAQIKSYLKNLGELKTQGLVDATIRVEKNYILEFQIWKSQATQTKFAGSIEALQNSSFIVYKTGVLQKERAEDVSVTQGEGATFQFKTKKLKAPDIEKPFRSEFLPYVMSAKELQQSFCRESSIQF